MIVKHLNKEQEQILQSDIIEDDTIEMIKYKVSQELGCEMHEIYLFSQQERYFNLHTIYEELLKKTDTITSDDVDNICSDFSIESKKKQKKKDYTYDELLNLLNIDKNTIYFPIGHTLRECANPFKCTKPLPFDRIGYKIKKQIQSLSKTVLLDYLPFIDNTLYAVRKSDVDKELHESYFDTELDSPETIKEKIVEKTKFLSNQQKNNITDSSIRIIKFTILPTQNVQLSLESIFNLFHATELYPMIHYYTGKTVIYKLFTQEKDVHNHKIPVLAESVIYHVGDKDIKVKSVNIYVDNRNSCVLFYEDGSIGVHIKKSKTISEKDLNTEIQKLLLPILQIVKEPVYQSGYEYSWNESSNIFTSSNYNVQVDELEYEVQMNTHILDHKDKFKYFSNVCIDITVPKEESQFIYIYKSEYDSNLLYDQVIKYLMAKLDTSKKITDRLKTMFNLSDANAKKLFTDYAPSETSAVHSTAINIGFKISFVSSPPTVVIHGINNIHYLPSIKTNFNCISNIVNQNLDIPIETEKDVVNDVIPKPVEIVEDFDTFDAFGGDASAYDNDAGEDEEEGENTGGGIEDLDKIDKHQYDLKNPNFAINRLKSKYTLKLPDGTDYNKKCLRQFVPIIISKKEWETEKYKLYRDRLDTMENGDKFVNIQDDHVLVCPKYWSFKKQKAYIDEEDFEKPRSEKDIYEFNLNSKKTRYDLNKDEEYYEYPTYHHSSNKSGPAKYPSFTENNFPCCEKMLHKKKVVETEVQTKIKENSSNQYIVGKVEPIDTKEKVFKYGYLPEPLYDFFDLVGKKTFRESVDSEPYELLRWGVPNKNYQFLHTMHTIYKLTNKDIDFKTYVGKMEDGFKYAQNGNIFNKYLSFQEFMKDSKHIIHEEAWDLVSSVHDKNIIIFKDNDESVELICPSNIYGKKIDSRKQCIMLYYFEKDNCYEPIIKKPQNKHDVQFEFDVQDIYLKQAFETITKTYEKCKPIIDYEIEEDDYNPVSNISSTEMYDKLYDKYEDIQQVSQYNKCIGFIVEDFFIPCYPSKLIRDVNEIDEPTSKGVVETIEFLNRMHSSFEIPCRPHYKVIKQSEITGILTETFHYVPCIPEKNTKKVGLEPYYGNLTHEYIQFKENSEDLQRVKTTQRILYEKYGFTYCKNQLMIALNQHEYVENRNKIKKLIHSKKTYNEKLEEVTQEIHKVLRKHLSMKIEWVNEMPDEYIQDMLDQCPNGFCEGKLYLPKINLVTKEPNDYYKRVADELIRNKQVELFVLKPEIQFYVPYQGQDSELILDGNVIENYLEQLGKPAKVHKYYDNVNMLMVERKKLIFSVIKLDKIKITE